MSYIEPIHTYSFSQLSQFAQCPFQFYLNYIEHIDRASNAYSEFGTLVHDLIDLWAKGEIKTEALASEYDRRYADEVVSYFPPYIKSAAEKTYQSGLDYFTYFDEFRDFDIISTELSFTTDIASRPFQGVIDMVATDKDTGKLFIIDHKSKSESTFKKSEDEMYRQQYLYSKYVHDTMGKWPDVLAFNLFKEGGVIHARPFDMQEFESTIDWANKIMTSIEEADITDWLDCKKQDFFCTEVCSARRNCPNGTRIGR